MILNFHTFLKIVFLETRLSYMRIWANISISIHYRFYYDWDLIFECETSYICMSNHTIIQCLVISASHNIEELSVNGAIKQCFNTKIIKIIVKFSIYVMKRKGSISLYCLFIYLPIIWPGIRVPRACSSPDSESESLESITLDATVESSTESKSSRFREFSQFLVFSSLIRRRSLAFMVTVLCDFLMNSEISSTLCFSSYFILS